MWPRAACDERYPRPQKSQVSQELRDLAFLFMSFLSSKKSRTRKIGLLRNFGAACACEVKELRVGTSLIAGCCEFYRATFKAQVKNVLAEELEEVFLRPVPDGCAARAVIRRRADRADVD